MDAIHQHDTLFICIDHEPDDYLALIMLANYLKIKKTPKKLVFVGGGGDACKFTLTQKMAEMAGFSSFYLIDGRLDYFWVDTQSVSDSLEMISFPTRNDGEWKKAKVFPVDCFGAFGCTKTEPESYVPYDTAEASATLDNFISSAKNPGVIALKPLWEFVHCQQLQKCTLYMYGSFNIRQMYDSKEYTKKQVARLLASFQKTFLYEAFFATGPDNSMSLSSHPELFETLKSRPEMLAHMRGWNDALLVQLVKKARDSFKAIESTHSYFSELYHMFDTILEVANKPQKTDQEYVQMLDLFSVYDESRLTSPEYLEMYGPLQNKMEILMKRNITIIKSILVAHGLQMVIADFALMALLLAHPGQIDFVLEPSAIQFNDQSLTVATPDPPSSIFIVRNVNRKQLFDCVQEWA